MDNQQLRPKGNVQRLFLGNRNMTIEVRLKRVGENPLNGNGVHPSKDEDIVCTHVKVCGVFITQRGVATL